MSTTLQCRQIPRRELFKEHAESYSTNKREENNDPTGPVAIAMGSEQSSNVDDIEKQRHRAVYSRWTVCTSGPKFRMGVMALSAQMVLERQKDRAF
jgi:hypothetical protein